MSFTMTEESFETGVATLRALVFDPAAELTFDHFRGALVWRDEFHRDPRLYAMALNLHADLIVYRGCLIEGRDDIALRPIWERARELLPDYPVFRPERRIPELAEAIDAGRQSTRGLAALLERLDRRCRAQAREES